AAVHRAQPVRNPASARLDGGQGAEPASFGGVGGIGRGGAQDDGEGAGAALSDADRSGPGAGAIHQAEDDRGTRWNIGFATGRSRAEGEASSASRQRSDGRGGGHLYGRRRHRG